MNTTLIVISGTAQSGSRDAVYESFRRHLAPRAEANEAQPLVVWASDRTDPDRFTLVEFYNSSAAMAANAQADWFWAYLAEVGPLLAGEPMVTTCDPRWAKGLDLGAS